MLQLPSDFLAECVYLVWNLCLYMDSAIATKFLAQLSIVSAHYA